MPHSRSRSSRTGRAGLQLLDDRDHRRGKRDVVHQARADRRRPRDAEKLGGAVTGGDVRDPVGDRLDGAGVHQGADHHKQADKEKQRRPLDPGQRPLERLAAGGWRLAAGGWRLASSIAVAPDSATVAGSRCSVW
jgi:hypothetical protein